MPAAPSYLPARDAVARVLIWAGVAACAAGFVAHRMWLALPAARFGESLAIAALAALLAWPCVRVRGWAWADALMLVWVLALIAFGGLVSALAVAVLAAGAMAVGAWLLGPHRPWLAWTTGAGLIAGVAGWVLPLPVHRIWIYLPLLGALIVWQRASLRMQARHAWASWRSAVSTAPRAAAWSVIVLGLASGGAWLPTMQYDDLAYHLGLPWQLLMHGRYALDPTHQVWALAPWAGDVLQGIAQVIARAEARGALNFVWLLCASAGLWGLSGQFGLRPTMRWGVVALFASLPLVAALMAGMQTELPATATTVALAALAFETRATRRELVALAVLIGFLIALKPLHAVAAVPLIACALWRNRALLQEHGWQSLTLPLLAVLIGGSSYAYAAAVAGNPVLPLFNATFRSPYFAARDFYDARWNQGFDIALPWDLTFDTSAYLEGWDGAFGFVLLALAGAIAAAATSRDTRVLVACGLFALLAPLVALQYARYAFVGLVLLIPAALAVIDRALSARATAALVVGLCTFNIAFQTNANWMLHTGAVKRAVGALGRDEPLLARYAPERVLAARVRAETPGSRVLDMHGAAHAEFAGNGRTTTWYAPAWEAARVGADADASGGAWSALLRREAVSDVLLRPASLGTARRAGLTRVGAYPVLTVGEAQWWHVPKAGAR